MLCLEHGKELEGRTNINCDGCNFNPKNITAAKKSILNDFTTIDVVNKCRSKYRICRIAEDEINKIVEVNWRCGKSL
jgi:hypothetical protein